MAVVFQSLTKGIVAHSKVGVDIGSVLLRQLPKAKALGLSKSSSCPSASIIEFLVSQRVATHASPRRVVTTLYKMFIAALWSLSIDNPQD